MLGFGLVLLTVPAGGIEPDAVAVPQRAPAGLNRAYSLVTQPATRINATYAATVTAPGVRATEWVFFLPRPPDLPSQRILSTQIHPDGEVVPERSPLRRPVFRAVIPVRDEETRTRAGIEARTEAVLFSRKLVRTPGLGPKIPPVLSAADRANHLQSTRLFNHDSPALRRWVATHGLERGPREGEVDHARRVFQHIARNFDYEYLGKQDRSAAGVCAAGKSDCGGLSVLFAAVMRSQGIPTRTLAGRWAISAIDGDKVGEVDYHQEHIIAEFFAEGLGWVPVDPAGAVVHDRTPEKLTYFGNDAGRFLTLHLDAELWLDTGRFGVKPMVLLQRPSYWVTGPGSTRGATLKESWTVTRRPPPGR